MNDHALTPFEPHELWNAPSGTLPPSGPLLQRLFFSLFGDRPFSALEIGVHTATKVQMAMKPPLKCRRWVGVDPYLGNEHDPYRGSYWKDPSGAEAIYRTAKAIYERLEQPLLRLKSQDYFRRATERFDLVFVDGDHRLEPTLDDLRGAMQVVKPGGILLIDDYGNSDTPAVTRAINQFIQKYDTHIQRIGHQYFRFQNKGKHLPVQKAFVYLEIKTPLATPKQSA